MKIHSDVLTYADLLDAVKIARVDFGRCDEKGSRSRARGFDVTLTGESRRRPNDQGKGDRDAYAATWDQWGVFLAALFDRDPKMVTPYYEDAKDFAIKTDVRFGRALTIQTTAGTATIFQSFGWPSDAHGDHTFRFDGVPGEQSCSKCSAVRRW